MNFLCVISLVEFPLKKIYIINNEAARSFQEKNEDISETGQNRVRQLNTVIRAGSIQDR
jgi:hypothetical protein